MHKSASMTALGAHSGGVARHVVPALSALPLRPAPALSRLTQAGGRQDDDKPEQPGVDRRVDDRRQDLGTVGHAPEQAIIMRTRQRRLHLFIRRTKRPTAGRSPWRIQRHDKRQHGPACRLDFSQGNARGAAAILIGSAACGRPGGYLALHLVGIQIHKLPDRGRRKGRDCQGATSHARPSPNEERPAILVVDTMRIAFKDREVATIERAPPGHSHVQHGP